MSKPISIYKLAPTQISLIGRLAISESGIAVGDLDHREIVGYQELDRVGMADMSVGKRRSLAIVLTDLGRQV